MFLEGGVAGAQPLHKGGPKARPYNCSGQWLVVSGQRGSESVRVGKGAAEMLSLASCAVGNPLLLRNRALRIDTIIWDAPGAGKGGVHIVKDSWERIQYA